MHQLLPLFYCNMQWACTVESRPMQFARLWELLETMVNLCTQGPPPWNYRKKLMLSCHVTSLGGAGDARREVKLSVFVARVFYLLSPASDFSAVLLRSLLIHSNAT